MDIDRYIALNQASWDRLEDLTKRARRDLPGLTPGELEELVQLYQRASAQLSYVRTYYRDQPLIARLTRVVATANGVIYGKRPRTLRSLLDFFSLTFPGALYHYRRYMWISAALFFIPAILTWVWLAHDPTAIDLTASRAEREVYVNELFEQYYSNEPHPLFFVRVTVNNIQVSLLLFAAGIVVPVIGPTYVLLQNSFLLGSRGAWMTEAGQTDRFLGFILPHGMLELSAIVIAGGAALALGWSVIAPGDRRRTDALREEGRRLVVVILGLMTMFGTAGLIEGFITGSGLPPAPRVAIGALGWVAFMSYLAVQGRAAAAAGITGAWREEPRSWVGKKVPTSDSKTPIETVQSPIGH
ncbi:MAG: stage II sporulation protein M [Acidimicrobiales bacterium]|nr:stage II sporulation protein M [Acidimicrobiales bacterium]